MRTLLIAFFISLINLAALAGFTPLTGPTNFASDDAFLDYVEQQSFNYFLDDVNATTGLVADRDSTTTQCSIAAVGFDLSCINVGIDRGWITRSNGAARVLTTLQTLCSGPKGSGTTGIAGYQGWFYHFLNMNTGLRNNSPELSTIDTSLMMLGVIDVGQYFNSPTDTNEFQIRQLASSLVNQMNWNFMLRSDNKIYLQWTPETGFTNIGGWTGYDEAMCMYLVGLGAATNPLPTASWTAWTSGYVWSTNYGYSYVAHPPMFVYQYSHVWIDFRQIADAYMQGKGIDYFENSRRATLVQQQYAIQNSYGYPNYGTNEWGISACDGPNGYVNGIDYAGYTARGIFGSSIGDIDDGTIAPTAVGGSLPFAPEICLPALYHLYYTYPNQIWTTQGFRDAFNIKAFSWFDNDTIGIDEGPIVLMIENYRTGSVWQRILGSPIIQRGLQRAGFTAPPPDQLAATAISPAQINLTWRDNSAYETGFQVESSTNNINFVTNSLVGSGITNVIVSAVPGIINYYRVRTTSANGMSGYRQIIGVLSSPIVAMSNPMDGASVTAPATISLAVNVVTNGSPILKVQFYYNQTNLIGESVTSPYTYVWTNVSGGIYSLTAQAIYNGTNQTSSLPITVYVTVPGSPAIPGNAFAVAFSTNQINLSWSAASGATGYIVNRNGTIVTTQVGTTYSDTGLNPGTQYSYTVVATNNTGNSAPSAPALAATEPMPATLVKYTFDGTTTDPTIDSTSLTTQLDPTNMPNVTASRISEGADNSIGLSGDSTIGLRTSTTGTPANYPYLQVLPGNSAVNSGTSSGSALTTGAAAMAANSYFTFIASAVGTNRLFLDSLSFDVEEGGSGTRGFVLQSSVGGFSTDGSTDLAGPTSITNVRPNFANIIISLEGLPFQGISNVTFRIYSYSGGTSSSLDYDNIALNGRVGGLPTPNFNVFTKKGSNVMLGGSAGLPNGLYVVLATTNLTTPTSQWVHLATNYFDAFGRFAFTNTYSSTSPQLFYKLQLP